MLISLTNCPFCKCNLIVKSVVYYVCQNNYNDYNIDSHYYIEYNGSNYKQVINLSEYRITNDSNNEVSSIIIKSTSNCIIVPRLPITTEELLSKRIKLLLTYL